MQKATVNEETLKLEYSGSEAMNTICTNISFSGKNVKRIVVTSCEPNDGKSFVAIQISVNMAKRVRRTQRVDIERVGLGDYIAPPSTVQVLYNNLKCPKSIKFVQGSNHGYVPPEAFREECVFTGK